MSVFKTDKKRLARKQKTRRLAAGGCLGVIELVWHWLFAGPMDLRRRHQNLPSQNQART